MSERRRSPIEPETTEPQHCSVDVRLEILSQVPFFEHLDGQKIARINQAFLELGFTPGETIYFSGDPAERLYVVAAGKVKLLRHTAGGRDVLIDMLNPGEFFGALSSLAEERYLETAQAQTAACVLSIEREEFREILDREPTVALKVLDAVSERLQEAHEMVRQLSAHSVEHRIAYTLLKLAEKFGEQADVGLLIQVPLSRDDLAEMTGTTTETASRVMSQFQKEGLINSGRQWIAVVDRQALQAIAGIDDEYHLD